MTLYKRVAGNKNPSVNVGVSPFSAEAALTVALLTANGTTKREIDELLGSASESYPRFISKSQAINRASTAGFTVSSATGMFLDKSYKQERADKLTAANIDAEIAFLDFAGQAEQCRVNVNQFVAGRTQNRIPELFPSGSITRNTRLVIANALYFKADWEIPFDTQATSSQLFTLTNRQQRAVDLMYQEDTFNYAENRDLGAQLVELRYKNDLASMVVLLPSAGSTVKSVEDRLNPTTLNAALSKMKLQKIQVHLPKFRLEAENKLDEDLKALGVVSAFSNHADFTVISPLQGLQISQILQKVFIGKNNFLAGL